MNSSPTVDESGSVKRRRISPIDDEEHRNGVDGEDESRLGQPLRRKRGRHAAACASCHRRKQRCDGDHPCFNCNRRNVGHSCTYTNIPAQTTAVSKTASATAAHPTPNDQSTSPYSVSSHHESMTVATLASPASTSRPPEHRTDQRGPAPSRDDQIRHPASVTSNNVPVGDLFKSRDAPSFFGSSYFGPQAAAKIIEAPAPDFASGLPCTKALASSTHSFRDEGGPFSQIWDLLGLLPRKKSTVDRLTACFLDELNWAVCAVEPRDFKEKYDTFWSRKFGFDDFATVDLRWLALLFIVLAYGVLLDCPKPRNGEVQREVHETSLRFYWAARRAIVIAPTFYGESIDLVRAGVLVTRYLIYSRRVPESWLTTSFAMRMAQAQGMHIDGERWRLSRQQTEIRRRLWTTLYTLDKTIALALGRPFAIVDQQCLVRQASNVDLDDLSESEAEHVPEQPLSSPTQGLANRLAHELAVIVGRIQERCFGLFAVSYDTVLALDSEIVAWETRLPANFKLHDPDTSLDAQLPWLPWNRLDLHSMYHFARVTLHRPFLLRQSITNRYRVSNDACISSACADLDMRLKYFGQSLSDRMKWTLGPHHLFNSALVLGIIVVRDPRSRRSQAILEDLAAYCEMQRNHVWVNEFALAEVKICELCIKKARQMQRGHLQPPSSSVPPSPALVPARMMPSSSLAGAGMGMERSIPLTTESGPNDPFSGSSMSASALGSAPMGGNLVWDEESFVFPETADLLQWEHVLNSIMQDQLTS